MTFSFIHSLSPIEVLALIIGPVLLLRTATLTILLVSIGLCSMVFGLHFMNPMTAVTVGHHVGRLFQLTSFPLMGFYIFLYAMQFIFKVAGHVNMLLIDSISLKNVIIANIVGIVFVTYTLILTKVLLVPFISAD